MLSRRGATQVPRQFDEDLTKADEDSGKISLCDRCAREVFNASFYARLRTAWEQKLDKDGIEYTVSASDLYHSIVSGCRWCSSIGNAILTSAELDYWYSEWKEEESDSDTESVGVHSVEGRELDEGTALDEAEKASELAGPSLKYPTLELLQGDAEIRNRVVFERDSTDGNLVLVRCTVEVTRLSEDCVLPSLEDEDAVNMSFEAISPGSTIFRNAWPALSPADESWELQARAWLDDCKEHDACRSPGGSLPSRLVYVGKSDGSDCARVILATGENNEYPYVALSYVRGGSQPYALTTANLDERLKCLPTDSDSLPQTIADAIKATRSLGHSYLWIDTLCILQDSPEDEQRELPKIRDIYKNSAVTLLAARASSTTEGFLKPLEELDFFVKPFNIAFDTGEGASPPITLGCREFYQPSKDPINHRAWTLQERALSTRVISFSYNGVKWACKTCGVDPSAGPNAPPPSTTLFRPSLAEQLTEEQIAAEFWYQLRSEYSQRSLTHASDKLPAISAIAADVARSTGWTYLAGLWKENLFSELHWKVDKACADPDAPSQNADYVAPSWSWASIQNGSVDDTEDDREFRNSFHFRIISDSVRREPGSMFVFGRISSGRLRVDAKMIELYWQLCETESDSDITLLARTTGNDKSYVVGEATRDTLDWGLTEQDTVTCLAMSTLDYGDGGRVPVEGILVVPAKTGAMRRVGFFQIDSALLFEAIGAEQVDLI